MRFGNYFHTSVAVSALFAASAAHADLSADAVWESWQAYYTSLGQTLQVGSETRDGDSLIITDMTLATDIPDGGTVSIIFDRMILTEQGDGSVLVGLPDAMPLVVTLPEMDADDLLQFTIAQPDLQTVATAVEGGIRYDYKGPELSVRLTGLVADGEAVDATVDLTMSEIAGFYEFAEDGASRLESSMTAGNLSLVIDFEDPSGSGDMLDVELTMSGLQLDFDGTQLGVFDGEDLGAALRDGFGFNFRSSYDAVAVEVHLRDAWDEFQASVTASMAETLVSLMPNRVSYSTTSRDVSGTVSGDEIPFPALDIAYGEFGLGLSIPLSPGAGNEDVSIGLRLVDLVLDDNVWQMADPMESFPRGPVTAILDLEGKLELAGDIYDDEMLFMMMFGGPMALGELSEVRLNELFISAVGAEVTGEGQATLDYNDLDTFDGLPRPEGGVTFTIKGANALLDTLVNAGMVPRDEAQGARMMLGLFTRQVDGDADHLTTTLEAREDGGIYANGQRIQ